MKSVPWVVVDANDQTFKCKRCGGSEKLIIPARVEAFVKRGEAFCIEHEYCKPPPDEQEKEFAYGGLS